MPYCKGCGHYCETYVEDLSFSYSGTHCTHGKSGTHVEYGDTLSVCCDEEVIDYCEDEDER